MASKNKCREFCFVFLCVHCVSLLDSVTTVSELVCWTQVPSKTHLTFVKFLSWIFKLEYQILKLTLVKFLSWIFMLEHQILKMTCQIFVVDFSVRISNSEDRLLQVKAKKCLGPIMRRVYLLNIKRPSEFEDDTRVLNSKCDLSSAIISSFSTFQ